MNTNTTNTSRILKEQRKAALENMDRLGMITEQDTMTAPEEQNLALIKLDDVIQAVGLSNTLALINEAVAYRREWAASAGNAASKRAWHRVHTKLRHFITDLPDDGSRL